jgi:hypothetical protein
MLRRFRKAVLLGGIVIGPACEPNFPPEGGKVESAERAPHRKRRPLPEGTHEGAGGSLLAAHADRELPPPAEVEHYELTGNAKTLVVTLLTVAAKDRVEDLPALLTPDAGFGLPHTLELGRRQISADGGEAFLNALRGAASRFKKEATFHCPPILPAMETFVATGAEPMWCFYSSDDKLDLLVFRLLAVGGTARIAYVGLFDERPTAPVPMIASGGIPPVRPIPKMRGLARPGQGPSLVLPDGTTAVPESGDRLPADAPPEAPAEAPPGAPTDAPPPAQPG